MTKSTNHPDADYTPNDMGLPQRTTTIEAWSDFADLETNDQLLERDPKAPW